MFDGIFGGGGDAGFDDERKRIWEEEQALKKLPLPVLEKMIYEKYNPEAFQYKTNTGDSQTRQMQMQALQRMAGLAETGESAADAAAFAKARSLGGQMARQGTEAAIANAQARGVGGGGMEFAMREMANQGGAQRANEAALEQAGNAARQRAMYQQAYGNALSGFRNQNTQDEQANTDIINRFNQANTGARNQAGMFNSEMKYKNTGFNNQLEKDLYDAKVGKITGSSRLQQQRNAVDAAEEARRKKRSGGAGGAIGTVAGGVIGAYAGNPALGASIGGSLGSSFGENM